MLQIVVSLTEDSKGVIYNHNILIIQAKKVEVSKVTGLVTTVKSYMILVQGVQSDKTLFVFIIKFMENKLGCLPLKNILSHI
jgi:hypothetical protein